MATEVDTELITARPVRRLTEADLDSITELAADRGWPPEEAKWRLMFAVSEPYGVTDPAGRLAGVVVLTRYGRKLATIGMMVVATRYGRRGLGARLMRHALARAGDAVVYLTATGYGRPLYARLGFRAIDSSVTYTGCLHAAHGRPALRRVCASDLAAISAVDQGVFGADRTSVLDMMTTFADEFLMLGSPAGGYGAAWTKDGTRMIGPLVAPDAEGAVTLIRGLADGWPGRIRLDLLGRHSDLAGWAVEHGLCAGSQTTLMAVGSHLPGDRSRLYCPATVAIG